MNDKRRNYIVDSAFQSRFTLIIIVFVIIVTNITGGIIYAFLSGNFGGSAIRQALNLSDENYLLPVILVAEIISILVVGFLSVMFSHAIAGPVYHIEKIASRITDGDLTRRVHLRSKDQFKGFAEVFNTMADSLSERIGKIYVVSEKLQKKAGKDSELKEISGELDSVVKTFTLK